MGWLRIQNLSTNTHTTNRKGGLKLCLFETKMKSLKLSWVKRLCSENDATWKILPQYFFQFKNVDLYFSGNHPLLSKQLISSFYSEIHTISMNPFKKEPDN